MSLKEELQNAGMNEKLWKHMVTAALDSGNDSAKKLNQALLLDLADAGFEYYYLFVGSANNDQGGYKSYNPNTKVSYWQNTQVELDGWYYRAIIVYPN